MVDAIRLGVIGNPVAHSRSPDIFDQFSAQLDIPLSYDRLCAEPDEFAEKVEAFFADGGHGLNVTLPFKSAARELAQQLSDAAELAEAVNTLYRDGDKLAGDNTDGIGLVSDLARLGIEVADRRVLLLGAGGAARGVIKPLLDAKPEFLTVSNRNPWKPEALAERFASQGPIRACTHLALKGHHYDLIINATAAGHAGQCVRLPDDILTNGGDCYDVSYGEAAKLFLDWATAHGAGRAVDGIGMLVEQAAESCRLWTGQRPNSEPVIDALRASL